MESEQSLQFSTDIVVPSTDGQGSDYLQEPSSLAPPDDGVSCLVVDQVAIVLRKDKGQKGGRPWIS